MIFNIDQTWFLTCLCYLSDLLGLHLIFVIFQRVVLDKVFSVQGLFEERYIWLVEEQNCKFCLGQRSSDATRCLHCHGCSTWEWGAADRWPATEGTALLLHMVHDV